MGNISLDRKQMAEQHKPN